LYDLLDSYQSFNQPVDKLPNSITHLTFGNYFDQPVDKLPNSITHLTFGNYFNQPVDKLPNSIIHLTFCTNYSYYSNIPEHITVIKINYKLYKRDYIMNNFPPHIKEIHLDSSNNLKLINKIPFGCKIFDIEHQTFI
jgi:hypothetical protein